MALFKQDELNLVDSEVDNQRRGKQHYEEKQKEHLDTLNKKKRELDMKEKELEVTHHFFFYVFVYKLNHYFFKVCFSYCHVSKHRQVV